MEALGPVLVLASIPLMLRWIPRNRLYGFRVAATLRDDAVWYDANARCARHMFSLGVFLVVLEFVLPISARIPVLRSVAVVGMIAIIIVNWRAVNRLDQQRRTRP